MQNFRKKLLINEKTSIYLLIFLKKILPKNAVFVAILVESI